MVRFISSAVGQSTLRELTPPDDIFGSRRLSTSPFGGTHGVVYVAFPSHYVRRCRVLALSGVDRSVAGHQAGDDLNAPVRTPSMLISRT